MQENNGKKKEQEKSRKSGAWLVGISIFSRSINYK
jgi:hypothetical protein